MSKELKKKSTGINEVARQRLNITRDEYALCSYVQYRSADPRQKIAGWCCDAKDEMAEFVGVTRMGLYKMLDRLQEFGLVDLGHFGASRVTAKWIDTEQECKLSLQSAPTEDVNKVYKKRKQSLQGGVNKVDESIIINVEYDNKYEEVEVKPTTTTTENGTSPVNPEISQKKGMVAPPAAAGPAVDVAAELERLRNDESARENFTLTRRIPAANFDAYVTAFSREVSATAETYWKVADLRRHFFNWSGTRYEIECKNQNKPGASPAPGRPRDMVQL